MKKYKKTETVKKYLLPIEIIKDGDFFLSRCSLWTDCYAQGATIDEATTELLSVASSLIELYQEEDLKIPLSLCEKSIPETKISFDVPVFAYV